MRDEETERRIKEKCSHFSNAFHLKSVFFKIHTDKSVATEHTQHTVCLENKISYFFFFLLFLWCSSSTKRKKKKKNFKDATSLDSRTEIIISFLNVFSSFSFLKLYEQIEKRKKISIEFRKKEENALR